MTASRTVRFLRTTRGQLTVLGITYGCAVVFALIAVTFLSDWFENSVYEKFSSDPSERLRKLAGDVAAGREAETAVKELSDTELLQLYAVWIDEPKFDPKRRLATALWRFHGDRLLSRVRRTLVVGNSEQRLKSLELLETIVVEGDIVPARRLCEYAIRRSKRCGEHELSNRASALLRRFDQLH